MSEGGAFIGRVLGGRFTVTRLIGEGGMGSIYEGTCPDEPEGVAIKVLGSWHANDEDFVKRFQREAKVAASLHHRSTVRLIDHGVEDGTPYLVMELVKGAELAKILEHEKRLPEARTIRIMAQVCSALAAAHDQGIVHRDLKPENVMILRDPGDATVERVKVLDFGIAKMMEPEECTADALPVSSDSEPTSSMRGGDLTKMGTIVGTPDYMAPEQFLGQPVDARTDIYACGVLLHQMITGKIPLSAEHPMMTAQLRMSGSGPRPAAMVPDVLPKLDDLVGSALQREPAARPHSARKMQEQLLEMLPEAANTLLPLMTERAEQQIRIGSISVAGHGATMPSVATRHSPVEVGKSGLPRLFTPMPNISLVNLHKRSELGLKQRTDPGPPVDEVDPASEGGRVSSSDMAPTRMMKVARSGSLRGVLFVAAVIAAAVVAFFATRS